MPDFQLITPVAFIIFNRPDTTERVFAEIAKAKPPKLLVVGDGPRVNHAGEAEKVAAARAIIDRVDWDCEVLTNFSEVNLAASGECPAASTGCLSRLKKPSSSKMTVCLIQRFSGSAKKCLNAIVMTSVSA